MGLATAAPRTASLELSVTGMTCGGCAQRIERELRDVAGVGAAAVNMALERAHVAYDPAVVGPAALIDAVARTGFGVREERLQLTISGMTCVGCARRVEQALLGVPAAVAASVNVALDTAEVRALADGGGVGAYVRAVEAAGFAAKASAAPVATGEDERAAVRTDMRELAVAVMLTAPLVVQMLAMVAGLGWHLPAWSELLLATPVQFWIGRRFYRAAWHATLQRAGNMDQLIALGTSAAYFYSLWLVLSQGAAAAGNLYFEASAVIITLVLLGKVLEARAKRSATQALRELMALRPSLARVLRGGVEQEVDIETVVMGDMVVVKPGERLPVDGTVVKGQSELDESLLTGESVPIAKAPGEAVVAGAVNGTGLLRIRAERVGEDTMLAQVALLVARAQAGKAPVQRLVDRISAIFVPTVLAIAAATFAGWLAAGAGFEPALIAAVSVLVIACPCALGLATPAALVAGTGAAAKSGILIRDIEALERAHRIDVVVFDKTGTLTSGRPTLQSVVTADGVDECELLTLAAAAQRGSEHPLGKAVVAAAETRGLAFGAPECFEAKVGMGLEATVGGRRVQIGRAHLTGSDPALAPAAAAGEDAGLTMVWVTCNDRVLGLLGLADAVREDAKAAVAALATRGVRATLLTGDNRRTAERVGRELGIEEVVAEVLPDGKAAYVKALVAAGHSVAMVGDGVNDAPALAAADLGIAMGTGADVALEAAGVTLMRAKPALVASTLDVASRTRRKIRQNLAWAFAYNVVGIPIAALGLLSPAVAGAAMAASSVSVVANALILKRWTPAEPAS